MRKNLARPDLVVHELACPKLEHNLAAFEVKPDWAKEQFFSLIDIAHMKAFTMPKPPEDSPYLPTYQYGLFLHFTREAGLHSSWRFEIGKDEPIPFYVSRSAIGKLTIIPRTRLDQAFGAWRSQPLKSPGMAMIALVFFGWCIV